LGHQKESLPITARNEPTVGIILKRSAEKIVILLFCWNEEAIFTWQGYFTFLNQNQGFVYLRTWAGSEFSPFQTKYGEKRMIVVDGNGG